MRIVIISLMMSFSIVFAQQTRYVINSVSINSTFNDFAAVVVSVDVTYAESQSICCTAETRYDCEYDNSGVWDRAKFKRIDDPDTPIIAPLNWVSDEPVTGIAWAGNGNFRIEINGFGDGDSDSDGWYNFSVTDVVGLRP